MSQRIDLVYFHHHEIIRSYTKRSCSDKEVSTKYLVSVVLMEVFERKFGFHAGISSMTNILRKASR